MEKGTLLKNDKKLYKDDVYMVSEVISGGDEFTLICIKSPDGDEGRRWGAIVFWQETTIEDLNDMCIENWRVL